MSEISDVDRPDEPDVLGAARTLDVTRERRRRRPRVPSRRRRSGDDRTPAPLESIPTIADAPVYTGPEYVYEPHQKATQPLGPYLAALWERRAFLTSLAKSQLRGSRSSTTLGGLWGILDPLFQAAIYFFLFTAIRGSAGRPGGFLFVLICSVLLFQLSTAGLSEGGTAIRQGAQLMLNSTFPRALLPLASIYKGILKFIPALGVMALAQLVTGAPYHWGLLWLPLLFVIQIVGAIGLALGVSTLTVYFRDASNLINYVSRILFFTTPIIVPLSLLERFQHILIFQPLYSLFANYQRVFLGDAIDFGLLGVAALWAGGLLVVGGWNFLRRERDFASRL